MLFIMKLLRDARAGGAIGATVNEGTTISTVWRASRSETKILIRGARPASRFRLGISSRTRGRHKDDLEP
jgi:hypothetical protein